MFPPTVRLASQMVAPDTVPQPAGARWSLAACAGRVVELGGNEAAPALTLAFTLVRQAQQQAEPVAWLMARQATFFPPDVEAGGVSLGALIVVRVPDAAIGRQQAGGRQQAIVRAAERLVRSGGFGLVVLDLAGSDFGPASGAGGSASGPGVFGTGVTAYSSAHAPAQAAARAAASFTIPAPLLGRLAQAARHHHATVLCLTGRRALRSQLTSLISLRVQARREWAGPGRLRCILRAVKDKRHGPDWTYEEDCWAPPGLR